MFDKVKVIIVFFRSSYKPSLFVKFININI